MLCICLITKNSFLTDCQSSQPALNWSLYLSPFSHGADFASALRSNGNISTTETTAATTNVRVNSGQNNTTLEPIPSHSALSNDIYRLKQFDPNNVSPARMIYSKRYPQARIVYRKQYLHNKAVYYKWYSQTRVAYRGRYFGAGMLGRYLLSQGEHRTCWSKRFQQNKSRLRGDLNREPDVRSVSELSTEPTIDV